MPTYTVLGNCVGHRLQELLMACPAVTAAKWSCVVAPMIHTLRAEEQTTALARQSLACEVVFSQPLFSYGDCNTNNLKEQLHHRLVLFSAPNFEAYFPDVFRIPAVENERFLPPLEWHSSCIFQGYLAKIPAWELPEFYVNNQVFSKFSTALALVNTKEKYIQREQGVDISTWHLVENQYASTALFYTWQHPHDSLMLALLKKMLHVLQVKEDDTLLEELVAKASFSFNQWPIITKQHGFFSFEERATFRIGGIDMSLEDVAAGYYSYYDFHPQAVDMAKKALEKN